MKSVSMMLVGACLVAAVIATPATAATYIATYTGTVSSAYNNNNGGNLFGVKAADLVGKTVTTRYVIDTSKGATDNTSGGSYSYSGTYGGSAYGTTNPIVSSTITINGVTEAFNAAYYGGIFSDADRNYGDGAFSSHTISNSNYWSDDAGYSYSGVRNYGWRFDLSLPLSIEPSSFQFEGSTGSYYGFAYDYSGEKAITDYRVYFDTTAASIVNADPVAAVPEPATWGMMILGFGVVGASMRRRRSSARTSVRFA